MWCHVINSYYIYYPWTNTKIPLGLDNIPIEPIVFNAFTEVDTLPMAGTILPSFFVIFIISWHIAWSMHESIPTTLRSWRMIPSATSIFSHFILVGISYNLKAILHGIPFILVVFTKQLSLSLETLFYCTEGGTIWLHHHSYFSLLFNLLD